MALFRPWSQLWQRHQARWAWAGLALLLAIAGQWLLDGRRYWPWGAAFYGAALVCFVLGVGKDRPRPTAAEADRPPLVRPRWARWGLAVLAGLAGGITLTAAGGNHFCWHTVMAWAIACGCWVLAFAERPRPWPTVHLNRHAFALGAILLLAAGFRLYRLADLPGEMTIDHPHKLLDVRDVLQGQYRIFFPRNTGREPLQFYYTAALVRVFGLPLGFDTLKLGTALVSLAAVGATYALAAELFGVPAGLCAAALLAVSRWDLGISRIGLRYPFASLPLAVSLLFLLRALNTGRRNDALWCGLSLGLGLMGYSSFRVVPGLVVLALLSKVLLDRAGVRQIGWRRFWAHGALILSMTIMVFLPLGRYMWDNPGMFWYRVLTRTSDLETALPSRPGLVFLRNLANSLLAFNWRGDIGWAHLVQKVPFLDPLSGACFVLGVGVVLWWLVRYRDWRAAVLLSGLPLLLLPSSLALAFPIENPSANRSSVAIPLTFAFVGLAPGLLLQAAGRARHWQPRVTVGLGLCLVLALAIWLNGQSYFVAYDTQFHTQAWNASELAQVIRDFVAGGGDLEQAYIAPWPSFVDGRAVAFELGQWEWYNLMDTLDGLPAQAARPGQKLYLVHPSSQQALDRIREVYPQAQVHLCHSRTPGHDVWVVLVPEAQR